MIFERLTWVGFMIVAAGWALLFSAPQLINFMAQASGRSLGTATIDIRTIAQGAIVTGFGIGILGALQTGFGALNRFFEAVLERSQHARPQSGAPTPANPMVQAATPAPAQAVTKAIVKPQPSHPRKILERGWVKDRAYVLFTDGSVEVETMLGRRMFPSLQDAQEFIA